jgi:hypothetical protein
LREFRPLPAVSLEINPADHAIEDVPDKGRDGSAEKTPNAVSVAARTCSTGAIPLPLRDGSP